MAPRPPANPMQLPLAQWPEADRCQWTRAQQPAELFDDLGPGSDWSPVTWNKTTKGYGRFLAWLRQYHPNDLGLPAATRINRARITEYVEHLRQTTSGYSAVGYVEDLIRAHRVLITTTIPAWLAALHGHLRAQARPVRDKRAALPAADELVGCGEALMRQAETAPDWSARRRAVAYRDGLAIALLAYRPMRMKNFAQLRLGTELREESSRWRLIVPGAHTKNRKPYEALLPKALRPALERYIETYRPILLAGERNDTTKPIDAVWVSDTGTAWEQGAMSRRIANIVAAQLGRHIPPHWFRDAAATTVAIDAPQNIRDAHLLLGHATLATTERHYILAQSLVAGQRHQAMLDSLRTSLHTPTPQTAADIEETDACAS